MFDNDKLTFLFRIFLILLLIPLNIVLIIFLSQII